MRSTKKKPEFKPMTGATACIYCRKPLANGAENKIVNVTARDDGPRIGQAHGDCAALAAGLAPTSAAMSRAEKRL